MILKIITNYINSSIIIFVSILDLFVISNIIYSYLLTPLEKLHCQYNQLKCKNGQCIEAWRKCEKRIDCSDGSDEANCSK